MTAGSNYDRLVARDLGKVADALEDIASLLRKLVRTADAVAAVWLTASTGAYTAGEPEVPTTS